MEKKRVDLLLLSIYIKVTVEKTWGGAYQKLDGV